MKKDKTMKKRHLVGLEGEGRKGRGRMKRRFRIGTVCRNKRYSILFSLFNLRFDLPTSLFRPTSHPPGDDAPTRLDGSVATEEEGTRGGARLKGLYFHINDFMTTSFHPRERPPALSPLPPPPPGVRRKSIFYCA